MLSDAAKLQPLIPRHADTAACLFSITSRNPIFLYPASIRISFLWLIHHHPTFSCYLFW